MRNTLVETDGTLLERRNTSAILTQGILFSIGIAFIDTNTVVPLFVERFTGHAELAGAAATLRLSTTLLTQFAVGLVVPRIRNLPRYLSLMMLAGYSLPLLIVPVLLASSSGPLLVAALLAVVALFWMADGAIVIAWYDLLGRTVSARGRGRVLGLLQLFGSIGSVASALAIKAILDSPSIPARTQYVLIFLTGGLLLLVSALAMLRARDHVRAPAPSGGLLLGLRRLPQIWRGSAGYRSVAAVQVLFTLATMCVPHLLLFSKDQFALPPWRVTWLIAVQVVGALAGGLAATLVAPRRGNAALVALFAGVGLAVPATGLVALLWLRDAPATWTLLLGLMFLSGVSGAAWIGFSGRTIDVLSPGDLPVGMAAVSLVSVPLSFAPWAAGILAARAGFAVLLTVCAVLAAGALAIAVLTRRAPGADAPR